MGSVLRRPAACIARLQYGQVVPGCSTGRLQYGQVATPAHVPIELPSHGLPFCMFALQAVRRGAQSGARKRTLLVIAHRIGGLVPLMCSTASLLPLLIFSGAACLSV